MATNSNRNARREERRRTLGRLVLYLPFFAFAVVLASIWLPELLHYFVWVAPISQVTVDSSRRVPSQAVLEEIGRNRVLHESRDPLDREQAISDGNRALRGEFDTPSRPW